MIETEKTVLLIGGAGYIGSVLARQLLAEGYRVRVFDNLLFGSTGLDQIEDEKLEVIKADICNVKALSKSLEDIDAVILLAAIVGRRLNDVQRATMRDINLLASSVAVDASIEHGIGRFIFISSDSVYGTATGVIYETAIPEPQTLYSRLKLRMEERIVNAARRDFHPSILRIGSCYGYSPRMRFDLPVNQLLRDAYCKKEMILPSGEERRAFIHVEDAARAISKCLASHINLVSGATFNVCASGQNYSMREVANEISSLIPEANIQIDREKAGLDDYKLSEGKIFKLLDFQAKKTLREGLKDLHQRLNSKQIPDPYSLQFNNN